MPIYFWTAGTANVPCIPLNLIRLQGNESSDTQIGVEEASDNANTEVDSDAAYDSDTIMVIGYKQTRK